MYRLSAFSNFIGRFFARTVYKNQKVEKIDNNFILYHLQHAQ